MRSLDHSNVRSVQDNSLSKMACQGISQWYTEVQDPSNAPNQNAIKRSSKRHMLRNITRPCTKSWSRVSAFVARHSVRITTWNNIGRLCIIWISERRKGGKKKKKNVFSFFLNFSFPRSTTPLPLLPVATRKTNGTWPKPRCVVLHASFLPAQPQY